MTDLIPLGTTLINPEHVVSIVPKSVSLDERCLVTVHLTAGPAIDYVVDAKHMTAALVYVQKLITEADRSTTEPLAPNKDDRPVPVPHGSFSYQVGPIPPGTLTSRELAETEDD